MPDAGKAIFIHDKPGRQHLSIKGGDLWFCAAKNYSMCYLVRLVAIPEGDADELIARVALPFDIRSTRELFGEFFDLIQVCRGRQRAVTVHSLSWEAAEALPGSGASSQIFARVAKKGSVVLNLTHHKPRAPRNNSKQGGGPDAGSGGPGGAGSSSRSGVAGGEPLPLPPPLPAPGEHDGAPAPPADGIHIDSSGGFVYDDDMLEALARVLSREEDHPEAEDQWAKVAQEDAIEIAQDSGEWGGKTMKCQTARLPELSCIPDLAPSIDADSTCLTVESACRERKLSTSPSLGNIPYHDRHKPDLTSPTSHALPDTSLCQRRVKA